MTKFVTLVFALVALSVALADPPKLTKEQAKQKLLEFGKECAEETKATPDDIDALLKKTVPDTKTGKCMINCVYHKIGLMKDGKYNAQAAIETSALVHEENPEILEKVKKISQACEAESKGADECEIAASAMACGLKLAKEEGLLANLPV